MPFKSNAYELAEDPFPWLTVRFQRAGALDLDSDGKPTVPALSAMLGMLSTIVTSESENKQRFSIRFATGDDSYTDGKRTLVTVGMNPLFDTELTPGQKVAIMVALTLHEVGHVSWSMNARERLAKKFDFEDERREYWVMRGHNLVHDIMLEHLQGQQAPGYAPTFLYKEAYLASTWTPDLSTREKRWESCIGAMLYGKAHDWAMTPETYEFKSWADDFAARCRDRRAYSYTPYLADLLAEFIDKVGWDAEDPEPPAPPPADDELDDDFDWDDDESDEDDDDASEGSGGSEDEDESDDDDDPEFDEDDWDDDADDKPDTESGGKASPLDEDEDDSDASVANGEPDWDDEPEGSDDTDDDSADDTLEDEADEDETEGSDEDDESVASEDSEDDTEDDPGDDINPSDTATDDEPEDDEGDEEHDAHGESQEGRSSHDTVDEEMQGEAPSIHGDLKEVDDAEEWQAAIDAFDSVQVADRDKVVIGGGLFSKREVRIKRTPRG